jgi:hypothetical protein
MAFVGLYDDVVPDDTARADRQVTPRSRILIFTEGTILGFRHWWQFFSVSGYVPIGQSVQKIQTWKDQGAEISYLTSRRKPQSVTAVREILRTGRFPGERLFYRAGNERYRDIAERLTPDVLIEDDCRSIGGRWQMTITHVRPEIRRSIHSVVVREFTVIDGLPDDVGELPWWEG